MESSLLGIAVGLFAGLIPGAFSTVVASTARERVRREGMKVALTPVGTETLVMLAAGFVLSRLPEQMLRWIGLLGGYSFSSWPGRCSGTRARRIPSPPKGGAIAGTPSGWPSSACRLRARGGSGSSSAPPPAQPLVRRPGPWAGLLRELHGLLRRGAVGARLGRGVGKSFPERDLVSQNHPGGRRSAGRRGAALIDRMEGRE